MYFCAFPSRFYSEDYFTYSGIQGLLAQGSGLGSGFRTERLEADRGLVFRVALNPKQ